MTREKKIFIDYIKKMNKSKMNFRKRRKKTVKISSVCSISGRI